MAKMFNFSSLMLMWAVLMAGMFLLYLVRMEAEHVEMDKSEEAG